MHYDHKCNEEWAHRIDDFKFQEDVLIVAGNMCDSRTALVRALTTLKAKFRRVFWVPGNHEMWVHTSESTKLADSFAKLMSVYEACDELGVDVFPAAVSQNMFVVPLLSWYTAEFDKADPFPDPRVEADKHCRWPMPESQIWKYMLRMNAQHLQRPYHGTVISFSHFLPHTGLPHNAFNGGSKTMGCEGLEEQITALKGETRVHVYGHSTRRNVQRDGDIWYVNHYHGEEGGKEDQAPLMLLFDGKQMVKRPEKIYDGPPKHTPQE